MKITPNVPNNWNEFSVEFKYFDAIYSIKYKRGKIKKFLLNGEKVDEVVLHKKGKFNICNYF